MARLRVDTARSASSPLPESSVGSDSRSDSRAAPVLPACNIFNTTFLLYRASPLFVGVDGLSDGRLQALEAQLRDILAGDVVRGIEVGLDGEGDRAMGNAGSLEVVSLEWVSAHDIVLTSRPALRIMLQYENAQCMAILLPPPEASKTAEATAGLGGAFLDLPLLLLRMPASLKDTVARFLSSTFDCRIAPLHLSRSDIIHSWESWARATALPNTGPLARDAVLTLSFNLPGVEPGAAVAVDSMSFEAVGALDVTDPEAADPAGVGLKMVDVMIPNADLGGFLEAGQQLGLELEDGGLHKTPFTTALSFYLRDHLGLDMSNPAVEVVRVACGGFVLATCRLKVFKPPGSHSGALESHHSSIARMFGGLALRAGG